MRSVLASVVLPALLACASFYQPDARDASRLPTAPPDYPERLFARGVEGYVVLAYTVGTDGRAHDPVVLYSEPDGVFDAAALAGTSSWRFLPKRVGGQDVEARQVGAVAFCLPESLSRGMLRTEACRSLKGRSIIDARVEKYQRQLEEAAGDPPADRAGAGAR